MDRGRAGSRIRCRTRAPSGSIFPRAAGGGRGNEQAERSRSGRTPDRTGVTPNCTSHVGERRMTPDRPWLRHAGLS